MASTSITSISAQPIKTAKPVGYNDPPEGIQYWLPKAWVNSDDFTSTLMGCRTNAEFRNMCTSQHEFVDKNFTLHLWTFILEQARGYPSLQDPSIMHGKSPNTNSPINELANNLRLYIADPTHWQLVVDKPTDLISPLAVRPLKMSYASDNSKLAWTTAAKLNQLKICRLVLEQRNLGWTLSEAGPFEGRSLKMWTLAYMVARRMQYKANQQGWDLRKFTTQKIQNANAAPAAELKPVYTEHSATAAHATVDEFDEEADEADLEGLDGFDFDTPADPTVQITWKPEEVVDQWEKLSKWLTEERAREDRATVDAHGKNRKPRPALTPGQRARVIALGTRNFEVLAAGDHERLAKQSTVLGSLIHQSELDEPAPESENYAEWALTQEKLQEQQKTLATKAEFLSFQAMLIGGFGTNQHANTYRDACQNLRFDPRDPFWTIDGKKCGLEPWQVIGVDWLRRCWKEQGIQPLLADDCGLGKTIQALGAVYADYLDCKAEDPRHRKGDYRPTLVLAPRLLATNWFLDNERLLNSGLKVYIWAGRGVDSGNSVIGKAHIIDDDGQALAKYISKMDKTDPDTARTVIVTSYSTGWQRALLQDGGKVKPRKPTVTAVDDESAGNDNDEDAENDEDADNDEDVPQQPEEKRVVWSSLLEGLFKRVICDESHKAKSTKGRSYHWLETLKPEEGFWFLSATPMSNNIEDLTPYVFLNWQDEWRDDRIDPNYPEAAIGYHSMSRKPREAEEGEDPDNLPPLADHECPRIKGILDPQLFRACLRNSTMHPDVAKRYLPAVLDMLGMRRTMATIIDCVDKDGNDVQKRIGDKVPDFTTKTIELGYKHARLYRQHQHYQQALICTLETPGKTASAQRGGEAAGKRNMATHKRLQTMTLSAHMEPFTVSYMDHGHKAGVAETNALQEYGDDKGLSVFQLHAQTDRNIGPFSSRFDMASWLLRCSPKLAWLCDFVNKCQLAKERVVIFCQWPVSQWLIEATFMLLGLQYDSIRSEKTIKLRQEAVNAFTNINTNLTALVCSYATAALGLNIQHACHKVVHVELPHNMSTIMQANGRVHRLGQHHPQELYILCLDGSYDYTVMSKIAHKYKPELVASVRIPDNAVLGDQQRPPASEHEARARFDDEYYAAILSDIYGQPYSVLPYADVYNIPTRSKLWEASSRIVPDSAISAEEHEDHIYIPLTKAYKPRKASHSSTIKPITPRRSKRTAIDEPDSSPLAAKTKRAKRNKSKETRSFKSSERVDLADDSADDEHEDIDNPPASASTLLPPPPPPQFEMATSDREDHDSEGRQTPLLPLTPEYMGDRINDDDGDASNDVAESDGNVSTDITMGQTDQSGNYHTAPPAPRRGLRRPRIILRGPVRRTAGFDLQETSSQAPSSGTFGTSDAEGGPDTPQRESSKDAVQIGQDEWADEMLRGVGAGAETEDVGK